MRRHSTLIIAVLLALAILVVDIGKNIIATILYDPSKHNVVANKWALTSLSVLAVAVAIASVYWAWKRERVGTVQEPNQHRLEIRRRLINRVLSYAECQFDGGLYAKARKDFRLAERQLRIAGKEDRTLDVYIEEYYRHLSGPLVILGEPGTGKTTLLYELVTLLARDNQQDDAIPIAFDLSTWAQNREPLEGWLASELKRNYGVSLSLARPWIRNETILPMLDGLDEVPTAHRAGCVRRINEYQTAHRGMKPVITCREAEYFEVAGGIEAASAVVVRTMDRVDVEAFLEANAEKFVGLRSALENQPGLWELMTTPLMLWIGVFAFDGDADLPITIGVGEMRERLFSRYLERVLKRERGQYDSDGAAVFSIQDAKYWLHQTAVCVERAGMYSFHLEDVSLKWLPETQRGPAFWGISAITALVGGLAVELVAGHGSGFLCGIFLIFSGRSVEGAGPVDTVTWSRPNELWGHLVMFFAVGLAIAWPNWHSGIFIGLGGWLAMALGIGLVSTSLEKRMEVNGGLRKSASYAISLILVLVLGARVLWDIIPQNVHGSAFPLVVFFVAGLPLWKGGAFCIKNLTVRLALALGKHIPWRYATFLHFAVERVLMVRQGGAFRFVHRALQEHLAARRPR